MNKGILTVTVNPAVDLTVSLATDLRMRCSTNRLSAGGKGINVARVLRVLGVPAHAAGVAGGETGEVLRKLLRQERISADLLRVAGSTRVNVTILGTRVPHRILEEGPRLSRAELEQFEQKFVRGLRGARLVVICGRNAVGAPLEWYARLVRLARKEDVPAAVDTSGTALEAALKAKPFLIKPNREEAQALVRHRLDSPAQIKKALRHFHDRGVAVVLLSLGGRGAVASAGEDIWYARPPLASLAANGPPRVRAVNDVGCGDALLAGFLHAHCAGKSLAEALRQGVACGTANALNSVPGSIDPGQVRQLEKKVTMMSWVPGKCRDETFH